MEKVGVYINSEGVRQCCIKNGFYTLGTNEELAKNIKELEELAKNIKEHSATTYTIKDIKRE